MKKCIILILMIAFGAASAQIGAGRTFSSRDSKWTFGGNAGLGGSFGGGGGTTLYLSPRVGYKIAENFEGGLATNFTWANSSYFSSSMLGVGPYANYYFARSAFLGGMFQQFFVSTKDKSTDLTFSQNEAALYLGGGYLQKMGQHTYFQLGGMYNVLYKKGKSVFGGGFIPNVGIVFGL